MILWFVFINMKFKTIECWQNNSRWGFIQSNPYLQFQKVRKIILKLCCNTIFLSFFYVPRLFFLLQTFIILIILQDSNYGITDYEVWYKVCFIIKNLFNANRKQFVTFLIRWSFVQCKQQAKYWSHKL